MKASFVKSVIASVMLACLSTSALAQTMRHGVMDYGVKTSDSDTYIVVYKKGTNGAVRAASGTGAGSTVSSVVRNAAEKKTQELRSAKRLKHQYSRNFTGFAAKMSRAEALELAQDPNVAFVERDVVYSVASTTTTTQTYATWGLDRIDQRDQNRNGLYKYTYTGAGVRVYVLDSGVRASHTELSGRVLPGYNTTSSNTTDTNDCHGHGTHVSATIAGATYGVAKQASIVPVRVLNCLGSGSTSSILAGLEWVSTQTHRPAVVNMSLGGSASFSIDSAIQNLHDSGVAVVVAAGNASIDACTVSPARAAKAITVGSSVWNDTMSSFSNFGSCVDIFAPGSSVTSAGIASDTEVVTQSGTSMASPHVAGVVATYLQKEPTASAAQVEAFIKARATPDVMTGDLKGSVNLMLYSVLEDPVVEPPIQQALPKMLVSELASYFKTPWYSNSWLIYSGLKIVKEDGSPLSGAVVTVKESSGGVEATFTCKTNDNGECRTFRSYSRDFGIINLEVLTVDLDNYEYDSTKNAVSQISVSRPYIPWWWPF